VVEYLRHLYSNSNVALVGFSLGHQLIGRALGMQPRRNPNGWELSLCDVSLGEVGSRLFGRDTLVSSIFPDPASFLYHRG
jgi:GMP synthase-like glutamine amidotransferase